MGYLAVEYFLMIRILLFSHQTLTNMCIGNMFPYISNCNLYLCHKCVNIYELYLISVFQNSSIWEPSYYSKILSQYSHFLRKKYVTHRMPMKPFWFHCDRRFTYAKHLTRKISIFR